MTSKFAEAHQAKIAADYKKEREAARKAKGKKPSSRKLGGKSKSQSKPRKGSGKASRKA